MKYKIWEVYGWDVANKKLMPIQPIDRSYTMYINPDGILCEVVLDEDNQVLGIWALEDRCFKVEILD